MFQKTVVVHRGAALVITVVAGGCNPAGEAPVVTVGDSAGVPVYSLSHLPAWDHPEYQWDLTLERSIPTAAETPGGDPLLYQPQAYARLADGTLVVLDLADLRIAILHPIRNEVVRRFARSRGGPGEISTWNCAIWSAGPSSFWVLDPGNQRLSRFNVSGAVAPRIRSSGSSWNPSAYVRGFTAPKRNTSPNPVTPNPNSRPSLDQSGSLS